MVTTKDLFPFFNNKKILVTGHTGFKGTWLIQILARMGAIIKGYSLPAKATDLYHLIDGDDICESIIADIRDIKKLSEEIQIFQPDYIFHMAAQALVIDGYQEPLYTFETNVLGTANVLEALRQYSKPCISIFITTDKVYENHDNHSLFSEEDKLGGYDPYSASKAACEMVISSYRNSFFNTQNFNNHQKNIAVVRAGNVIGGGDFSDNRIIPDIVQAIQNDHEVILRNPTATRPWQHVLEPLSAYLLLATKIKDNPTKYNEAFNIGPNKEDIFTVEALTQTAIALAQKGSYRIEKNNEQHEAQTLMLDNSKIKNAIDWQPKFNAKIAIQKTMEWYMSEEDADIKCLRQIDEYFS